MLGYATHDREPGRFQVEAGTLAQSDAIGSEWRGRVFMTPDPHPNFSFAPTFGLRDRDALLDDFEPTPLRLFDDGRAGVAFGATGGPATQWHRAGENVTFGGGPIHPKAEFTRLSATLWHTHLFFHGPNRELRALDVDFTRWTAFDGAGESLGTGPILSSNLMLNLPAAGPLRLDITNDNYFLRERKGAVMFRAWTDTTRIDASPPAFSSLNVQAADGQPLDTVPPGSEAWLMFGITDWHYPPGRGREYKPINLGATRVEYRVSGTIAWIALEPQLVIEDILDALTADRPSDGAVYRCRIPAVAGAKAIDVRITAEDAAQNRSEWTLEPAFVIDAPKKRSVRH
jgi:hypothetical protein